MTAVTSIAAPPTGTTPSSLSYNLHTLPLSYSAKNTGCGFILLNHNEQMEILIHRKPYQNSQNIEACSEFHFPPSLKFINKRKLIIRNRRHNTTLFPEQIAIPRGRGEKDENILITAIRELIEETGIHLEKLEIFNVFFELSFVDDREYKYIIFMGYSQKTCVRLCSSKYLIIQYDETKNAFVVKKTGKSVYMENKDMANAVIQYKDYIRFMYESQLKCYQQSNYTDLFVWMRTLISERKQGKIKTCQNTSTAQFFAWSTLLCRRSLTNSFMLPPLQLIPITLQY